jgi:glycosyltransferase involved in cell wall biosynthesis
MKIIHATPLYAPAWQYGGPIRSTHQITMALVEQGHDVVVVTTGVGTPHEGAAAPVRGEVDGVRVVYCPARKARVGILSGDMTGEVRRLAPSTNVAHLTGVWQPTMIGVQRVLHSAGVPYVTSPRGALSPYSFTRGYVKKQVYYRLFEQRIERQAAAVHVTAPIEQHEVEALGLGVPIDVIPNSCDAGQWFEDRDAARRWREARGLGSDEFVVMHVGRTHHKKNLEFLLMAAADLPMTADWRLVLLGPVAERDRGYLDHLKTLLPRERLVIDQGSGDPSELRAAYTAADMMAIPSLHENFCNVVIESILCGTPVLSSPHVGASQLCESNGGVSIRPLDAAAWTTAMAGAMRGDRHGRLRMGVRTAVAARFSREAVGAAFEALYRRVAVGIASGAGV